MRNKISPVCQRCDICLEKNNKKFIKLNNCSHSFHEECVKNWIYEGNNTCPLCREIFDVDFDCEHKINKINKKCKVKLYNCYLTINYNNKYQIFLFYSQINRIYRKTKIFKIQYKLFNQLLIMKFVINSKNNADPIFNIIKKTIQNSIAS